MKKKHLVLLIIALMGSTVLTGKIFAQGTSSTPNIIYPVQELNNCKDEADCRAYCDLPENIKACVDFGEKNNLMSKEEVQLAKKFIATGAKGPGGCQGKDVCEEYCDNITHLDECLVFGEQNNLMSPAELTEAKQIQAALQRGVKMPNCGSKKACDAYCEESDHIEECVTFGMEAGFIQGKELEEAQKMIVAIKKGVRPPPCRGKEACDEYCSEPENMEMCMNFAIEAGFMNEQEAADSQKMLAAVKQGVKPPKCRGKEECDIYCSTEEHFEECMNFAEAAGFMSAEDAVMARKTKGKTPGNCKGKEQCEAFCNDPTNQETCFNFAKENGLISEEDLQKMEEGKKQMQESINQMPPEVANCLNTALGEDAVEKIKSGQFTPSQNIGDTLGKCFQQMGPLGPPPDMQGQNPGEPFVGSPNGQPQTGPGGCTNPEECRAYCENNPQECQNFGPPPQQPPVGQIPQQLPPEPNPYNNQGFNGPPPGINCSSPEECQRVMQEQIQNQIQQQMQLPSDGQYPQPPDGYPIDQPQFGTQPPPDGQYQYPNDQLYRETPPPPPDQQYQSPPPEGSYPSPDQQYSPPPGDTSPPPVQ